MPLKGKNLSETESNSEINVITSDEKFMLELIDSISNPLQKKQQIEKLLERTKSYNPKPKQNFETYKISELKKYLDQGQKASPISISSLHQEIQETK